MPDEGKERRGNNTMTDIEEGTVQILEDAAPACLDLDVCRTTTPNISVRAEGDDGMPVLEGHFSTFNDWYEINSFFEGHFMERVAPGAFKRTFNAAKSAKDPHRIQVLLEHGFDPMVGDKPLGQATTLEEDSEGARYEADLFDSNYVRDILPALRSGVYGSSFRFRVMADKWAEPDSKEHSGESDLPERTITEVKVSEFGPTVFPANPNATADVRSTTDEFYERLRTKNEKHYQEVVDRAAKSRGVNATSDEIDDPDADLENEVENRDESQTEDPQSEHSEDSRTQDLEPTTHSEDSQEEGTPSEGTPTSEEVEEVESRDKTCAHAFCDRKRTGKNSERMCFFN